MVKVSAKYIHGCVSNIYPISKIKYRCPIAATKKASMLCRVSRGYFYWRCTCFLCITFQKIGVTSGFTITSLTLEPNNTITKRKATIGLGASFHSSFKIALKFFMESYQMISISSFSKTLACI